MKKKSYKILNNIILGGIGMQLSKASIPIIKEYIKKKYYSVIEIDPSMEYLVLEYYNKIVEIMTKITKNKLEQKIRITGHSFLRNNKISYNIPCGEYYYNIDNFTVLHIKSEEFEHCTLTKLTISFIGKNHKKYRQIIEKEITQIFNKELSKINLHTITSENVSNARISPRKFNSIFGEEKQEIINFVDNWRNNIKKIEDKQQCSNAGILLYGEGGVGKSTYIKALAHYLKADIIHFVPDVYNIDASFRNLNHTIKCIKKENIDDRIIIIALEDVDLYTINREEINSDNETKLKKEIITNKLMNLLDGVETENKMLFIATTNYIDRLDDKFIRDGRFDFKKEIKYFQDVKYIKEMANFFNVDYNILCKNIDISMVNQNKDIKNGYPPVLVSLECKKMLNNIKKG